MRRHDVAATERSSRIPFPHHPHRGRDRRHLVAAAQTRWIDENRRDDLQYERSCRLRWRAEVLKLQDLLSTGPYFLSLAVTGPAFRRFARTAVPSASVVRVICEYVGFGIHVG